ncbi:hypothetical protein [Deferrisoma palaeochoriense]
MDHPSAPGLDPHGGRTKHEELPGDVAAALADREAVEEAAAGPAAGAPPRPRESERDRAFLGMVVLAAVVLVFLWIGGTALWGMRRQMGALEARLGSLEAGLAAEARTRNRAAVGRILADLEALRQSLPADQADRLEDASRALRDVASDL